MCTWWIKVLISNWPLNGSMYVSHSNSVSSLFLKGCVLYITLLGRASVNPWKCCSRRAHQSTANQMRDRFLYTSHPNTAIMKEWVHTHEQSDSCCTQTYSLYCTVLGVFAERDAAPTSVEPLPQRPRWENPSRLGLRIWTSHGQLRCVCACLSACTQGFVIDRLETVLPCGIVGTTPLLTFSAECRKPSCTHSPIFKWAQEIFITVYYNLFFLLKGRFLQIFRIRIRMSVFF